MTAVLDLGTIFIGWMLSVGLHSPSFLLDLKVACHGRITKRKRMARLEGISAMLAETRGDL